MGFKKNSYSKALANQVSTPAVPTINNTVTTENNPRSLLKLSPERKKEMDAIYQSMTPQEQKALKREVDYRKQKFNMETEKTNTLNAKKAKDAEEKFRIEQENAKIKKREAQAYKISEEERQEGRAKAKAEAKRRSTPTDVDSYLSKVYSFDNDIFEIDNSLAEKEDDFNMAKTRYDNSVSKGQANNTFKLDYEQEKRERDNVIIVRSRIALRRQASLRQLGLEVASKSKSNEDFVQRLQNQGVPGDIIREIMGILNAK